MWFKWPTFTVLNQYFDMTLRIYRQNSKVFMTPLSPNSQRRLERKENQAKNIEKWPESLGVMLEFKYIEHGLLFKIRWKQEWFGKF